MNVASAMLPRAAVAGLVLAGGRGLRMGGADKGLVPWQGRPLAAHALARLAPQVDTVSISANRNRDAYRALGVDVIADAAGGPEYAGPLAGILAGLRATPHALVAVVPCDAPRLPLDLVMRLGAALRRGDALAVAAVRGAGASGGDGGDGGEATILQPAFCLVRSAAADRLAAFLAGGGRAVHRWIASAPHAVVVFDDAAAFVNVNREEDLAALAAGDA